MNHFWVLTSPLLLESHPDLWKGSLSAECWSLLLSVCIAQRWPKISQKKPTQNIWYGSLRPISVAGRYVKKSQISLRVTSHMDAEWTLAPSVGWSENLNSPWKGGTIDNIKKKTSHQQKTTYYERICNHIGRPLELDFDDKHVDYKA